MTRKKNICHAPTCFMTGQTGFRTGLLKVGLPRGFGFLQRN